MKFHITFTYQTEQREKLLNFLKGGGLEVAGRLELLGCWITVETGAGFAVVETTDSNAIYEQCSRWSEYGEITVTPVIDSGEL